jgi:hypothetical protein
MFKKIINNPFFILTLGSILILFFLLFSFFGVSSKKVTNISVLPTPTAIIEKILPTQQQSSQSAGFDAIGTAIPLTASELKYPPASSQQFPGRNITKTGILVVTTSVDGTKVIIDSPSSDEESTQPINIAPFSIQKIPIGDYSITVLKKNYFEKQYIIRIEENKVTRLSVELEPIQIEN